MSSINLRSQRSANDYNTTTVTVQAVLTNIIIVESSIFLKSGYYLMGNDGQPTDNEILGINYDTNEITMSSEVTGVATGDEIVFSWERVVDQPLFNEDFDNSLYELNRTKLESNGSIPVTENFTFQKDIIGQQKLSIVDIESSGNTTLGGALSVSGAAQFNNNVIIATPTPELRLEDSTTFSIGNNTNTIGILGSLNVGLDLDVNGLIQTGSAVVESTLSVSSTATFDSNIQLNNTPEIILSGNDTLTIGSSTNTVQILGNLSVDGTITADIEGSASGFSGTTDGIIEGSSNLYFTESRARGAISVSGDLSYSPDGVISFNERSDSEIRGLFLADGDLNYSDGVFSVTTYKDSDVDNHLFGGTGVTYSNGEISIAQSVATTDDVTFNSVDVNSVNVGGNSALSNFSVDVETISFTTGEIPGKEFKFYDFAPATSNLSFNSFVVVRPPTNTTNYPDTLFSGAHIIDNAGSPEIRLIIHNQGNQAWPPSNINLDFGFLIIN